MDVFHKLVKYKNLIKDISSTIENLYQCLTGNVEKRITYLDLLFLNLIKSNKIPKEWLLSTNTVQVEMNFAEWISKIVHNFYDLKVKIVEINNVESQDFKNLIFDTTCSSAEIIVKYLTQYSIIERVFL